MKTTINGLTLNQIMHKVTHRKRSKSRYRYKNAKLNGKKIAKHRKVAMLALGKKLPPGAIVHHVDLNPFNNEPTNLVICPDAEYHMLLHERTKAINRGDIARDWISFLGLNVTK